MTNPKKGISVIPNPTDENHIASVYLYMNRVGLMDKVFYDGHTLRWFLDQVAQNASFLCYDCDGNHNWPIGFGMVNDYKLRGKRAEVSFGFSPGTSGFKSVACGKIMLGMVFDLVGADYVYGTTPSRNKLAIRYAKLIGMRQTAVIPNMLDYEGSPDDAVMSYIDREIWTTLKK